jgi:hypothetical protein
MSRPRRGLDPAFWIADADRNGKRFVKRAEEKLTAFLELEAAIRATRNSPD